MYPLCQSVMTKYFEAGKTFHHSIRNLTFQTFFYKLRVVKRLFVNIVAHATAKCELLDCIAKDLKYFQMYTFSLLLTQHLYRYYLIFTNSQVQICFISVLLSWIFWIRFLTLNWQFQKKIMWWNNCINKFISWNK